MTSREMRIMAHEWVQIKKLAYSGSERKRSDPKYAYDSTDVGLIESFEVRLRRLMRDAAKVKGRK